MTFQRYEYNQDGVGDVRRLTCFGGVGAALGPALGLALGPILPGAAPVLDLGALPVLGSSLPAVLAGAEGGFDVKSVGARLFQLNPASDVKLFKRC